MAEVMCECTGLVHGKDCEEYAEPQLLMLGPAGVLSRDYVVTLVMDLIEFYG